MMYMYDLHRIDCQLYAVLAYKYLLKHLPEIMDAYQTFMNVVNSVVSGVVQSESHHHNTSEHETAARPSGILHEHEKHASHAKKHQKYPQEGHKTSKHKSHKRGERPE